MTTEIIELLRRAQKLLDKTPIALGWQYIWDPETDSIVEVFVSETKQGLKITKGPNIVYSGPLTMRY